MADANPLDSRVTEAPRGPRIRVADDPDTLVITRPRREPVQLTRWTPSPAWRFSLLVYLTTRLSALAGLAAYLLRHPGRSPSALALKWDGWWYLRLAAHGYSSSLRPPLPNPLDWHHWYSDWAFFPGYPLLIRLVREVTGLPLTAAAVGLSVVLGLTAVRAVYALGEEYGGPDVGRGAAVLFAAWPGSAILGQPYSEGLFLTAAACCLLLLARRSWVLAGTAGAVATFTRPTGAALVAAAAVVAVVRLVRHRDVSALAAPVLAGAGMAAFALVGWWRTGDLMVWRHAENLWVQRFDVSHGLLQEWVTMVTHLGRFTATAAGRALLVAMLFGIGGTVALGVTAVAAWRCRRHPGLPLAVYGLVSVLMIVGYSAVGPRPRTLLAVLPAFVWVAAWWPRRVTAVVAGCLVPFLAVVTYTWCWQVTP